MNKEPYKLYGYGAILGDIVGRPFEAKYDIKPKDVSMWPEDSEITDDTLMTLATMAALMNNTPYDLEYRYWGNRYYREYYGKSFKEWLADSKMEFDSYGNGCIMRMSPVCHFFKSDATVIQHALKSLGTSHKHDFSEQGVIVLAMVYNMIRNGVKKPTIKKFVESCGMYVDTLQKFDSVDATVHGTLPVVMNLFITSPSTEDGILRAVYLGGDTDTNASIVGELLATYHRDLLSSHIECVHEHLDEFQLETLTKFNNIVH